MSSKHFFDSSESLVLEALESLSLLDPGLIFDKHHKGYLFLNPLSYDSLFHQD